MPKFSVIIPTWNHLEDALKPCIESILTWTLPGSIEIIVVANGCTDGTEDYLKLLKMSMDAPISEEIKCLSYPEPLGFPKAVNEGLKIAKGEYLILLNNDCVLTEQKPNTWLDMLEEPFIRKANIGITGSLRAFNNETNRFFILGFCMMISRECFEKTGYFDEKFGWGSSEDIAYCILAQDRGFEIMQVPTNDELSFVNGMAISTFPLTHKPETTVHNELKDVWEEHFKKNLAYLRSVYTRIAVVMPVYNAAATLKKAIRCVLDQMHPYVDLYVCIDYCTDESLAIAESFNDKRMNIFKNTTGINGPSQARNIIINNIPYKYKYIAFCDADDFWLPTHLTKAISELKDADVVYSQPKFIDINGQPTTMYGIPNPDAFDAQQLFEQNYIYISSVVADIRVVEGHIFSSYVDSIEDWVWHCENVKRGFRYKKIPASSFEPPTVFYTTKTDGMAAQSTAEKYALARSMINEKADIRTPQKKENQIVRLNLACGQDMREGYINIDLYEKHENIVEMDVEHLSYDDNYADEILALHIIEHFHFHKVWEVLKEWYRVLKPGGRIRIETPDLYESCKAFIEGDEQQRIMLYGHFFCFPWVPGQAHYFLFTEQQLGYMLHETGFKNIARRPPISKYVDPSRERWYLFMEAEK